MRMSVVIYVLPQVLPRRGDGTKILSSPITRRLLERLLATYGVHLCFHSRSHSVIKLPIMLTEKG